MGIYPSDLSAQCNMTFVGQKLYLSKVKPHRSGLGKLLVRLG
jgi:hypothetical protein